MNIVKKTAEWAVGRHRSTNHLYNSVSYETHLEMVFKYAQIFSFYIPEENRDNFLAAAWAHEVIEDCRQTYNDVVKATNVDVAELAYALTNEKGRNRKERANAKYYQGIKECPVPGAVLLKVCDRLANFEYSVKSRNFRMAEMYACENAEFVNSVDDGSCADAIYLLNEMVSAWEAENMK